MRFYLIISAAVFANVSGSVIFRPHRPTDDTISKVIDNCKKFKVELTEEDLPPRNPEEFGPLVGLIGRLPDLAGLDKREPWKYLCDELNGMKKMPKESEAKNLNSVNEFVIKVASRYSVFYKCKAVSVPLSGIQDIAQLDDTSVEELVKPRQALKMVIHQGLLARPTQDKLWMAEVFWKGTCQSIIDIRQVASKMKYPKMLENTLRKLSSMMLSVTKTA